MHYFYTSVKIIKYFYVFYNALCNTICILYLFFQNRHQIMLYSNTNLLYTAQYIMHYITSCITSYIIMFISIVIIMCISIFIIKCINNINRHTILNINTMSKIIYLTMYINNIIIINIIITNIIFTYIYTL